MENKQIEYILEIAKEQNIARAAQNLGISRSALNYYLLNLEKQFGIPLFHRIKGNMLPTDAGKLYIEYGRKILELQQDCNIALRDMSDGNTGVMHLGVTYGLGQRMFTAALPDFNQEFPRYEIKLFEANVNELVRALIDGEIDLMWGAIYQPIPELQHILLDTSPLMLVVPEKMAKHPFDPKTRFGEAPVDIRAYRDIPYSFLNESALVRSMIDELFHETDITPRIIFEGGRFRMMEDAAQTGVSATILPKVMCNCMRDVVYYEIAPKKDFSLAISHRKGAYLSHAEKYYIDLLRKHLSHIIPYYEHGEQHALQL
ncbi:MAG: LysR family transcriptional regulator [Lachnospiraceae bacterium]|nr:LysR family transcriptional regulator [Lachnospiraceae bacterium]